VGTGATATRAEQPAFDTTPETAGTTTIRPPESSEAGIGWFLRSAIRSHLPSALFRSPRGGPLHLGILSISYLTHHRG
jgi:hypothetical protein